MNELNFIPRSLCSIKKYRYAKDVDVVIGYSEYEYGNPYLGLYVYDPDYEVGELFCDATINLPNYFLADNEAAISKDDSKITEFLVDNNLALLLEDKFKSGMEEYDHVIINNELIQKTCFKIM